MVSKLHGDIERLFQRALPGLQKREQERMVCEDATGPCYHCRDASPNFCCGQLVTTVPQLLCEGDECHCFEERRVRRQGCVPRHWAQKPEKPRQLQPIYRRAKRSLAQVLDGENATPAKSPNCAVTVQESQSSTSSESRKSNVQMQAGATSFSFQNTVFNGVTFNFGNSQALQQKRKSLCLKLKKKSS